MTKISTKDRIADSALELFSEKGYDGVGIDLIAERAGIKGPSIYKHYKGKEDILRSIVENVGAYYDMNFGSQSNPGRIPESTEELLKLSMGRLAFTMDDPMIRKTRRLLMMEQYRNPELAEQATKHSVTGIVAMYEKIFAGMIEKKILKDYDPKMLALEFASPVSLLIQICDRHPDSEAEILKVIENYFRHFIEVYENK